MWGNSRAHTTKHISVNFYNILNWPGIMGCMALRKHFISLCICPLGEIIYRAMPSSKICNISLILKQNQEKQLIRDFNIFSRYPTQDDKKTSTRSIFSLYINLEICFPKRKHAFWVQTYIYFVGIQQNNASTKTKKKKKKKTAKAKGYIHSLITNCYI